MWAIELLPFDITYKPRRAIKSQVLADFMAEWTEAELPKEYGTNSNWVMMRTSIPLLHPQPLLLYILDQLLEFAIESKDCKIK